MVPDEDQPISELRAEVVLGRLDEKRQERIISAFRECVEKVRYHRSVKGNEVRHTPSMFAIPFWTVWRRKERFTAAKVGEFARCYGFEPARKPEIDWWNELFEWLKNEDKEEWRTTLRALADLGFSQSQGALRLLSEARDDVLIAEYRERLQTGNFARLWFDDIISYWMHIAPPDRFDVLRTCYQVLREKLSAGDVSHAVNQNLSHLGRHPEVRILLILMAEGDDWAWVEFSRLLKASLVPSEIGLEAFRSLEKILAESQARVLVQWYASVLREEGDGFGTDLSRALQSLVARCCGEAGARELRRLRRTLPASSRAIVSNTILRIEDQLLAAVTPVPNGPLLEFVNRPRQAVIRDERDLFEAVCEAIEEVEQELNRGESVAGYWDASGPKGETACQNMLWPRIRDKLRSYGLSTIEERYIGNNRADLWVESPRPGEDPLAVVVELKTARPKNPREWLVGSVRSQLWAKYLRLSGHPHGIHIVLWFRKPGRYEHPKAWESREALAEEIQSTCKELEIAHGLRLGSYVLDVTQPFRQETRRKQ